MMLKRLLLAVAVAGPVLALDMIAAPTAEAQWGPPHHGGWDGPPPRRDWDGPPRHHGWHRPPPPHWGWRPPPPRCWTERQRVWVETRWGPQREWRHVRVCR